MEQTTEADMSSMKTDCERIWAIKKDGGSGVSMVYQRPQKATDLKREGRTLTIRQGKKKMVLDGVQIRSLKSILKDVGEVKVPKKPTKINHNRCRVRRQPVRV